MTETELTPENPNGGNAETASAAPAPEPTEVVVGLSEGGDSVVPQDTVQVLNDSSPASEPPAVVAAAVEATEPMTPALAEPVVEATVAVATDETVATESVSAESVSAERVAAEPVVAESVVVERGAGEPAADSKTTQDEASAEVPAAVEADPASFKYQPGDIVRATVTAVGPNGIEADLGDGDLAVVPRAEVDVEPAVGDSIEGQIIKHQAGSGRYVISPKRAAKARAWLRVLEAFEKKSPISGKIVESTKGGLIVDLGLRAFLPESLIDVRKPVNPKSLIGQEVSVMVIECQKLTGDLAAKERRSEKVVVNRRILREDERKAQRNRLLSTLQPGDRMTGTVTAVTDFGAFVDLGGAEGLVHVSELAHRNIAKPSDVVKPGDEIDVIVLDVKTDKGKISLSHKATLQSPWQTLKSSNKVGDLVYGTVTSIAPFGAFVLVEGDGFVIEGLVHVSELSRFRVESPSEVVNVGEGVWTKILAIEPDKKRLSLSLRRALEE